MCTYQSILFPSESHHFTCYHDDHDHYYHVGPHIQRRTPESKVVGSFSRPLEPSPPPEQEAEERGQGVGRVQEEEGKEQHCGSEK